MELDRRMGRTRTRNAAAPDSTFAPGKCTLTEQQPMQQREAATPRGAESDASGTVASTPAPLPFPASSRTLQMLFGVRPAPAEDPAEVHGAAARGTATAAMKLPHADQIQRAFGRHDISRIQAHASGEAAASAREMGARAYAAGDHVVLGESADLHTVAHEAAHVIQQHGGVRLEHDMGRPGDPHEQHADAVASAVVAGNSAEALLDRYVADGAASASPTAAVQHSISFAGVSSSPVLIAAAIRRAFVEHGRDIRKLHPQADAVLAAIAAPADLPRVIQEMMQADRNFGHYDVERREHLEKLFVLLRARLPWNEQRRITKKARLRGGAKAELRDDPTRVPLTNEEDRSIGYAQLPLLEFFQRSDRGTPGFRYFDAEERTAHMYTFDRGKLVAVARRDTHLRTRDAEMSSTDRYQAFTDIAAAMGLDQDDPVLWQREEEINREIETLGAMMIYVMNATGDMFVAKEEGNVVHHSTFLAGGAVAGAGKIRTDDDGTVNFISNDSGHYTPAPAYLWQVVDHMKSRGVHLSAVKISVFGMSARFRSAQEFYDAFNPSEDPRYFDEEWGAKRLDAYLASSATLTRTLA